MHKPGLTDLDVRIVIMGAGFGGIGAAVRLLESGQKDFVLLERSDRLGGVWRDNRYPGCRCDVPSHLYSFSFAPNPRWRSTHADREEVWQYLLDTATTFGLPTHIRFDHAVLEARWDDHAGIWTLRTNRGSVRCRYLISATGTLSEPMIPSIPDTETFAGTIMHSARWNSDHYFKGERVAIVGTGASAVQIVPSIQPEVEHLTVFQRTPGWVVPHHPRPIPAWKRRLFERIPATQRLIRGVLYWRRELAVSAFTKYDGIRTGLERRARRHLAGQVADPWLRAQLTPKYQLGCKRVLPSDDFYPAISQSNVELVTEPIVRIEPDGVVTQDGRLHPVNAIVFATGFRISDNPMAQRVVGRESHRLSETLSGDLPSYLGTTLPWFPNFFMLSGPNTGTGHTSQLYMIESQLNYIIDALEQLDEWDAVAEVLEEVATEHSKEIQRRSAKSVWGSGCASWYQNDHDANVVIWPNYTFVFRHRSRHFDPADYRIVPGRSVAGPSTLPASGGKD